MVSPQVKKIRDLRSTGMSLREIAEKLKITRLQVEKALVLNAPVVTKKASPAAPTSEKKATDNFMKASGKAAGNVVDEVAKDVLK